jgi:HAE1 family hydrophobic/amphiphilic exporter-1
MMRRPALCLITRPSRPTDRGREKDHGHTFIQIQRRDATRRDAAVHRLTGQSLNAVSLIGIVVMIGIADNDAVVKLAAIQRFRELGHGVEEAVHLGGRQRLRPIIMTSVTTLVGVLPMMFGWGSGGELYQPLAASVIGGSVTALLVTLFLLPTAYAVVEKRKERRA